MLSCRSKGYFLTEVLVALLVLSAGVIGAAGLQLSTWRLTQQSAFHTEAQQLAAEMAEWIQAYKASLPDNLENLEVNAASALPVAAHCYGRQCTGDELAHFMVAEWVSRVRDALPQAQVRICRDATPWDSGAASYRWPCHSHEGAGLVIKIGWFDKQFLAQPVLPLVVVRAAR